MSRIMLRVLTYQLALSNNRVTHSQEPVSKPLISIRDPALSDTSAPSALNRDSMSDQLIFPLMGRRSAPYPQALPITGPMT